MFSIVAQTLLIPSLPIDISYIFVTTSVPQTFSQCHPSGAANEHVGGLYSGNHFGHGHKLELLDELELLDLELLDELELLELELLELELLEELLELELLELELLELELLELDLTELLDPEVLDPEVLDPEVLDPPGGPEVLLDPEVLEAFGPEVLDPLVVDEPASLHGPKKIYLGVQEHAEISHVYMVIPR